MTKNLGISMFLKPLQNYLPISLLVLGLSKNSIAHNRQSTIVASIILVLKECRNLLLRLHIIELNQAQAQESVEDNHVLAELFLDSIEVLLDIFPESSAGARVCSQSHGTCVHVLGGDVVEEEG